MFCDFETTTHGKWILAGEHAVLRSHGALVFPVREKELRLHYQPAKELSADYTGASGTDIHLLFWSVLEYSQQLLGDSLNRLTGHFQLDCSIPVGVGMGASAALCVAVARWFAAQRLIGSEAVFDFARQLENLFHGKSSGLDIAGVGAQGGIYFNQGILTSVNLAWHPKWYLSSCGQIGITSHCISRVNDLWIADPIKAKSIDDEMDAVVNQCRLALETYNEDSQSLLCQAINRGAECFYNWGLVSDNLQQHMDLLLKNGALAVKPTGSGNGGYVISLWDKEPEIDLMLTAI
ncbi:mevalonate kinase [Legionella dresdenensis]|uniref:Mevalonate kinase n=1 Tax=Legionella dresdenensis TaxID=450200 RepID=A0ABV8CCH5_9GAMM